MFSPIAGQNSRGNITIWGSFPSLPGDEAPRRVCDIYGGFNGNSWGSEYMAIGVGNSDNNDASNPTIEQVRIYTNTITLNKPISPNYSYPVSSPSYIGWSQLKRVTTYYSDTTMRGWCCNDVALPQGIYRIDLFSYFGYPFNVSYFYTFTCWSNSYIGDGQTTDLNNTTDYHIWIKYWAPYSIDWGWCYSATLNNTGSNFHPYWAAAVATGQTFSGFNNVLQMVYTRIG